MMLLKWLVVVEKGKGIIDGKKFVRFNGWSRIEMR